MDNKNQLMPVSEILKQAWAVIDTPEKWMKGDFARDSGDRFVSPSSDKACQFCSLGALQRVTNFIFGHHLRNENWTKSYNFLNDQFVIHTGENIVTYNDRRRTTHDDIAEVWAKAIAEAERLGI